MNKAVAVVGMCGSGKSVLCRYFTDCGWDSVYFGGVAVSRLRNEGLPVNEANERRVREQLRADFGMGAFAVVLKEEILDKLSRSNVVLDGLYSWSEYVARAALPTERCVPFRRKWWIAEMLPR